MLGTTPDIFDFVLAVVIALFLWTAASAALASAQARGRLPALVARGWPAAPSPSPTTCRSPRPSAGPARPRPAACHRHRQRRPVGVVNEAALRRHARGRRPWVAVSRWPAPSSRAAPAGRHRGRGRWSARSPTCPAREYLLVEDDGSIYGVLSTADVERAFREARGGRR